MLRNAETLTQVWESKHSEYPRPVVEKRAHISKISQPPSIAKCHNREFYSQRCRRFNRKKNWNFFPFYLSFATNKVNGQPLDFVALLNVDYVVEVSVRFYACSADIGYHNTTLRMKRMKIKQFRKLNETSQKQLWNVLCISSVRTLSGELFLLHVVCNVPGQTSHFSVILIFSFSDYSKFAQKRQLY